MPSTLAVTKVAKSNPAHRWDKIDEPEWKDRHQPQEQEVAEGVRAKALRELRRHRPGAAHQVLAERALRDQEDADRADGRADQRGGAAEHGAEQDAARHGEEETARNGQRHHDNIERDIGGKRTHNVPIDEIAQNGVLVSERLERQKSCASPSPKPRPKSG